MHREMTGVGVLRSPADIVANIAGRAERFDTECGDGTMVWRRWGNGPPVLLLHGAHGAWTHWIRNIEQLAARRTVWIPDLPGYGESAVPPRIDGHSIAAVLSAGVAQLISRTPVDVVAFSLGGVLGAHLAVQVPALVRRLILVDTGGLGTPLGLFRTVSVKGLKGDALLNAYRNNLLGLMLHDPESADELALMLQAVNVPRGRISPNALIMPDKLLVLLPHISAQIDAIWGEYDVPHPDLLLQRSILRRFQPRVDFRIVPEAGHWSMYERAGLFNETLSELLDSDLRCG